MVLWRRCLSFYISLCFLYILDILQGRSPFASILRTASIPQLCKPLHFFELHNQSLIQFFHDSNYAHHDQYPGQGNKAGDKTNLCAQTFDTALHSKAFDSVQNGSTFGRLNRISCPISGKLFAYSLEIMPPSILLDWFYLFEVWRMDHGSNYKITHST